jgi:hypothetical protein
MACVGLPLVVGLPFEPRALGRVLLPLARLARQCGYHVAEQPCVPRLGQSHIALRPHLPAVYPHHYPVRAAPLTSGQKLTMEQSLLP